MKSTAFITVACICLIFESTSYCASIDINSVYNPFEQKRKIIDKPKEQPIQKEPEFVLRAIFEDKALINGRWIDIGDSLYGYKLIEVKRDIVFLKSESKTLKIKLFSDGGLI